MTVLVPYQTLLSTVAGVFAGRGMPTDRAMIAAEALCHGELTGVTSHGLVNLTRLYLPLFDDDRTDLARRIAGRVHQSPGVGRSVADQSSRRTSSDYTLAPCKRRPS